MVHTSGVVPAAGQGGAIGRNIIERGVTAPGNAAAGRQRPRALRLIELIRMMEDLRMRTTRLLEPLSR